MHTAYSEQYTLQRNRRMRKEAINGQKIIILFQVVIDLLVNVHLFRSIMTRITSYRIRLRKKKQMYIIPKATGKVIPLFVTKPPLQYRINARKWTNLDGLST